MLMEQFELSISPVFNEVIHAAEAVFNYPDDEAFREDLGACLRAMAEFMQTLSAYFQEAIKIRPKTELSVSAPKEFEKELQTMTSVISALKDILKEKDVKAIPELLDKGRGSLTSMFDIFERMKKEEESFPVFSKSPYIQEIVRIATGVAKNQYKPEALRDKLHWLRDRYLEFKDDFAGMKDIPKENEDVEKLIPIAEQALNRMGASLDKMAAFLRNYDKQLLKDGCSELLQSSEVLIAVQERMMKASTAQPAACPNCGAMNPGGAKRCRSCSAQMPSIVGLSTQTLEIKENNEEGGIGASYTYLVRLQGACGSYRKELISFDDLKREINFFAEKVKAGKEKFAQMKKQYADQPHTEQTDLCYKELETGIGKLSEGLGCLNQFLTDKNSDHIDKGLEKIFEGAEAMTYAQSVSAAPGA